MTLTYRFSAALIVPALTLTFAACGGGGGKSDKDKITDILNDGAKTPAKICDHLDDATLKALGGKAGCLKASKSEPAAKNFKIFSIKIDGDNAVAKVHDNTGDTSISFKKTDGDWKVVQDKT